jgi:hypothetical protein
MPASEKGEKMVLAQMAQATEIALLVRRSKGPSKDLSGVWDDVVIQITGRDGQRWEVPAEARTPLVVGTLLAAAALAMVGGGVGHEDDAFDVIGRAIKGDARSAAEKLLAICGEHQFGAPWEIKRLAEARAAVLEEIHPDLPRNLLALYRGGEEGQVGIPLTRAAVHDADNAVLLNFRRTDYTIQPPQAVANNLVKASRILLPEIPAGVTPQIVATRPEVQSLTRFFLGMAGAAALDGIPVVFIGGSGSGKTLFQLLTVRYIVERLVPLARIIVIDTHPELWAFVEDLSAMAGASQGASPVVLYYSRPSKQAITPITTAAPDLLVVQETNSLHPDLPQVIAAATSGGARMLVTSYALVPPVVDMSNVVQVVQGAMATLQERLPTSLTRGERMLLVAPSTLLIAAVSTTAKSGAAITPICCFPNPQPGNGKTPTIRDEVVRPILSPPPPHFGGLYIRHLLDEMKDLFDGSSR